MVTQPQKRQAALAGVERRRNPRIRVVAPVVMIWRMANGTCVRENGRTLDVSRSGALVRLRQQLPFGQVVAFAHGRARCWTQARVVRNDSQTAGGDNLVGVELESAKDGHLWA